MVNNEQKYNGIKTDLELSGFKLAWSYEKVTARQAFYSEFISMCPMRNRQIVLKFSNSK
jgi:hypothetical protein